MRADLADAADVALALIDRRGDRDLGIAPADMTALGALVRYVCRRMIIRVLGILTRYDPGGCEDRF